MNFTMNVLEIPKFWGQICCHQTNAKNMIIFWSNLALLGRLSLTTCEFWKRKGSTVNSCTKDSCWINHKYKHVRIKWLSSTKNSKCRKWENIQPREWSQAKKFCRITTHKPFWGLNSLGRKSYSISRVLNRQKCSHNKKVYISPDPQSREGHAAQLEHRCLRDVCWDWRLSQWAYWKVHQKELHVKNWLKYVNLT